MLSISVLIVEDNPITAKDLYEIVLENGYRVAGIAYNARMAIKLYEEEVPDIALIDIKLTGEQSGIDLVKEINKTRYIPVVYISGNSDKSTVSDALKTNPKAFLTKPFEARDVEIAMELALGISQNHSAGIGSPKTLFLKVGGRFEKVKVAEILYLEADGSYCKIRTPLKDFLITGTLKVFVEQLENQNFRRIHKSFLVNMNKVESISNSHVKVGETLLPLGRKFKDDFKQEFTQRIDS